MAAEVRDRPPYARKRRKREAAPLAGALVYPGSCAGKSVTMKKWRTALTPAVLEIRDLARNGMSKRVIAKQLSFSSRSKVARRYPTADSRFTGASPSPKPNSSRTRR